MARSSNIRRARLPIVSGITARSFDGVDDQIQTSIGGVNQTGAFTLAALVRKHSDADNKTLGIITNVTSASGYVLYMGIDNADKLYVSDFSTNPASTTSVTQNDSWVLLAVTKAAGPTTPRAHIYKGGAWTHEAMTATLANPASQAGGTVRFGQIFGALFSQIDLAVAAEWTSELSDGQIDTLDDGRETQAWADLSPQALWDFNQASVGTSVTDLIGGGADQTAITGTTVINDGPAAWTYGTAAAAIVPLGTAAAVSAATLILTAPAIVVFETAAATSSATLTLTAPATVVLATAVATSSPTLALTAETTVVLAASAAISSATLTVTSGVPLIPLETAAATSSATLALSAPGIVTLASAAAQSSATLALTAKPTVVLATSTAVSTATLTLTAKPTISLATSAAVSTATLTLTAQTVIPLGTAAAVSATTLVITAGVAQVPLATAVATSSATLTLTAAGQVVLATSTAISTATLTLRALTIIPLGTSSALSSTSLDLTVPGAPVGESRWDLFVVLHGD